MISRDVEKERKRMHATSRYALGTIDDYQFKDSERVGGESDESNEFQTETIPQPPH